MELVAVGVLDCGRPQALSATAWLELACIHVILSDKVWTNRPSRRTPAEQAAMDARENAERFRPVTGDVGIYDPAAPGRHRSRRQVRACRCVAAVEQHGTI